MSYDVHLEANLGAGPRVVGEDFNYTYNVGPMFVRALGHPLLDLSGRPGVTVGAKLDEAIANMEAYPGSYKKLNPENGWGDYEGALAFLKALRDECRRYPAATVRIT